MTPSQTAKAMGLKSLTQASDLLGTNKNGRPTVSLETLTNWHRNKPELFEVVILGCLAKTTPDHKRLLLNLLAVIHGDGGHHSDKHGVEKSTIEAIEKIYALEKGGA